MSRVMDSENQLRACSDSSSPKAQPLSPSRETRIETNPVLELSRRVSREAFSLPIIVSLRDKTWANEFIVDGKQVRLACHVQNAISDDRCSVNCRAQIHFAQQLLLLGRSEYPEVAIFVADENFAVGYQSRTPHMRL